MRQTSRFFGYSWACSLAVLIAGCGNAAVGGGGGYALLIGGACSATGTSQCSLRPGGGSAVVSCDGTTWQETTPCSAQEWCAVVGGAPPQCMATGASTDASADAGGAGSGAGDSAAAPDAGGGQDGSPAKDAPGPVKDVVLVQDTAAADTGGPVEKDTPTPKDSQPDLAGEPDAVAEPDQTSAPDIAAPDTPVATFAMPKFSLTDINPNSPTYKQPVSLQMFAGKRIVVLAGAGWCPSCVAQTKGMEKIRAQLAASGRDDFALVAINDVSASSASNQKAITTGVKVAVVQSTSAVNGWKIMGAQKNDGFFFDYDGKKRGFFQGAGTIYTNIWEEWIIKSLGQEGQPTTGYNCKNGGAPGQWGAVCSSSGL